MTGVAALGVHLLGADAKASLGPMTAAVVVMAVGGRVTPSGDASVPGVPGSAATGAIHVVPLGVALAGALPPAWLFLRGLRGAGALAAARTPHLGGSRTGYVGRCALPLGVTTAARTYPGIAYRPGPYNPSPVYRPPGEEPNPYKAPPEAPAHSGPDHAGPAAPAAPHHATAPPAPAPLAGPAPRRPSPSRHPETP
jgi:hypothetical protein